MTTLCLPAVFSNHMILCRNRAIRVWGQAETGRKITVSIGENSACTIANEQAFTLRMPPMPAGGPHRFTVTDGVTTLALQDVLIGDVYLAGGQSNMELELQNSDNGKSYVHNASNAMIRFYQTPRCAWLDEQALRLARESGWRVLRPDACGDISAVAYHFAVKLQQQLGIPIGIIGCNWGGTSVTCWIQEAVLQTMPEGQSYLSSYFTQLGSQTPAEGDREEARYALLVQKWNDRVTEIRTTDSSIPWEKINANAGDYPWPPPVTYRSFKRPGGLAQTMLLRIAPFTLTGILYYQGEEDTPNAGLYQALLTRLVLHWRTLFEDAQLPFLLVQLPMYIGKDQEDLRDWPVVRNAQEVVCQTLKHTGLAVLIDLGEFDNIHPTDKQTVGNRLYQQAMKVVYHQPVQPDSPRALLAYRRENAFMVQLDQCVRCTEENPALFELAGEDGVYRPAKAELCEAGRTLRLTCDATPYPEHARYAWVNYGKVDLFNESGLPLAPFTL